MLLVVIFPVLWIVSMAIDPRDVARPTSLIPPGASLKAFAKVFTNPTPNPVTFLELARNSALLAVGVSVLTVLIGTTAAYAFSRFRFPGRQVGMLGFVIVLMFPSRRDPGGAVRPAEHRPRPTSCATPSWAWASPWSPASLPFAIWNMKGFIDTIPKELEEAASSTARPPTRPSCRSCCRWRCPAWR